MKRREYTALIVGITALPRIALAQKINRMRRVGVLMNLNTGDPEAQTRIAAFMQGLQEAGWVLGNNLQVDFRWGGDGGRTCSGHARPHPGFYGSRTDGGALSHARCADRVRERH
jgi:hypothetical protein